MGGERVEVSDCPHPADIETLRLVIERHAEDCEECAPDSLCSIRERLTATLEAAEQKSGEKAP